MFGKFAILLIIFIIDSILLKFYFCMDQLQKKYGSIMDYFNKVGWTLEEIKKNNRIVSFHDGHNLISDGGLSLSQQIHHRIAEWFDGMTITDHNTLESIKEANRVVTNEHIDFQIINGIELSVWWKHPWHLIMMDFDLQEFDNIFYEKYLIQELQNTKENNRNLASFQPSRLENISDSKKNFVLINRMKQDPAYEYIIFPWDSFDQIVDKLLFHYAQRNISQLPIFQIPHPALWDSDFTQYAIQKKITNQWLTSYGTIMNDRESHWYYIQQFQKLKTSIVNMWGDGPIICYEKINQSAGKSHEHQEEKEFIDTLWCIMSIWSDIHLSEKNNMWVVMNKNLSVREYLLDKKNSNRRSVDIVDLKKFHKQKSLSQIINNAKNQFLFLSRWTVDPLFNEYPNLHISHISLYSKEFKSRAKQYAIHDTSRISKILRNISKKLENILSKSMQK